MDYSLNSRPKLVVGLFLGVGLLALACAPTAQAPGEKPAETKPPTAAQAQRGGILRYSALSPAPNLDPYTEGGPAQQRALSPAYDMLVSYKYEPGFDYRIDFQVFPQLAESWQQPDQKTYIFKLRQGVKFHNGKEFSAEDVLATYKRVRDGAPSRISGLLAAADVIEATDRYTVRITTKTPQNKFLDNLANENLFITPKELVEDQARIEKEAIGTGPMKLKSHDRTKATVFVRNEDFWKPGQPYLEGIETLYGLDDAAKFAAFVTRDIDIINVTDKPQADSVKQTVRDAVLANGSSNFGNALYMKQDKPPFSDARVRKALHLVVDRQELLEILTQNLGTINPPGIPGWKTGWAIPKEELLKLPGYRQPKDQDIAEAKKLLADAGFPNGFKTSIVFSTQYSTHPPLIEPLVTQLKKIGVDATPAGTQTPAYLKGEREGDYEVILSFTARAEIERTLFDYFHSKGPLNRAGINDGELDKLIDTLRSTFDLKEAQQAALRIQRLLLEKYYAIPTIEISGFEIWQPWVQNYPHRQSWVGSTTVTGAMAGATWFDLSKLPASRKR